MPSTKILQVINCIPITVILYFHLELMSKSLSLKVLGLKLLKLDCIIILLDLDTNENELYKSWMKPVACLLF